MQELLELFDIKPRAVGYAFYDEEQTCGVLWAFFDNEDLPMTEDGDDLYLFEKLGFDGLGYYGGPGRSFSDCALVRRGKFHTLITKRSGLDV